MVGTTLEVLDTSIVYVSLPHMRGSFSASVDEVTWIVTSYFVANGVMIPLTGWIASRFGRKRYFLASVTMFVLASALCGAAQSLTQMVIFRLLQGAAGAAMIPCSQAILMETFPAEERALAMATWGVGLMVAPIMGPTLGGWITDNWSWRWNFYINIPSGLIAAAMVYSFVHDPAYMRLSRKTGGRIDYLGIAYLVLGLGLWQIVLDRGERADWFHSSWVVYAAVIASLCLLLLVFRELRFPEPVIELRTLKKPAFTLALVLIITMSFAGYSSWLLGPLFLQEFMGYTAWRAGLLMTPGGLATMASMMMVGQLERYGYDTRRLIGIGFAFLACAFWMMSGWNLQMDPWAFVRAGLVAGIGYGMIFPTLSAASLSCIEPERMGYAASLYNMMRNTGAAAGVSILTTFLLRHEQIHQAHLTEHFSVFNAWAISQQAPRVPGMMSLEHPVQLLSGHSQGLGMIYQMAQGQAAMLSFNDIYRLLSTLALILIPASFLLLLTKSTPTPSSVH